MGIEIPERPNQVRPSESPFERVENWKGQFWMNPIDVPRFISSGQTAGRRKPYVTPACRRLSPEEAKGVLLRHADGSDPEVRRMLECIKELEKKKSSSTKR